MTSCSALMLTDASITITIYNI